MCAVPRASAIMQPALFEGQVVLIALHRFGFWRSLFGCCKHASTVSQAVGCNPEVVDRNFRMCNLAMPDSPLRVDGVGRITVDPKRAARAFPIENLSSNFVVEEHPVRLHLFLCRELLLVVGTLMVPPEA